MATLSAHRDEAVSSSGDQPAVVVVDHGSRREASNQMLQEFVELYRYRLISKVSMPIVSHTCSHGADALYVGMQTNLRKADS